MNATFWKRKLAAWLHDPAEKALVLMRDREDGRLVSHEQGSVARLRAALGIDRSDFDERADQFASAADRPQWPSGPDRPAWANVRWIESPVLVHPLSGRELNLGKLSDVPAQAARWVSLDHFDGLIERDAQGLVDPRLTFLSIWRFGPTPPAAEIGALWQLLPADTRVPDHSIWQHLDAVSALAGALHGDEPTLLTLAIGPVQGFIEQARSTSDLWAGSHLLASLAWEAMKPIVTALGPDAILFPALRGVPLVDLWLLEQAGESRRSAWLERFEEARAPWLDRDGDDNALFSAALPNKFTAIVPRALARRLAEQATDAVRDAALRWALEAARKLFVEVGRVSTHAETQIRAQLAGFPEVSWGSADWPTGQREDGLPDAAALQDALAAFAAEGSADDAQGLFATELWTMLACAELTEQTFGSGPIRRRTLRVDGHDFFTANAGLLYPAVHKASELALAAAKACRPFDALEQRGYRCTTTGEAEWLTDDSTALGTPRGQRRDTVWSAVAGQRPAWAKAGEHLGALATLKRLWPTLFVERLERQMPDRTFPRRPVSTHALALAASIDRLISEVAGGRVDGAVLERVCDDVREFQPVMLPRSLAADLRRVGDPRLISIAHRLPDALDTLGDEGDETSAERRKRIENDMKAMLGHRHETYYAAIKLDGDRMGAWLAGDDDATRLRFADTWHPQVRAHVIDPLARPGTAIERYVRSYRPASPARHMFVSSALACFSQEVARHIIEDICKGRLIYAGGDDLLALIAVDDLMLALLLLRAAYAGDGMTEGLTGTDLRGLRIGRDHVWLKGRLLPTMGARATLSAGAVIAHHTAPLAHVLRCLDEAERQAKADGRNRWHLRLMKRGGGEVSIGARFWPAPEGETAPTALAHTPAGFVRRLAETLDEAEFSRRAIYAATEWLAALPARRDPRARMTDADWRAMVATSLAAQFARQKGLAAHAREAVAIACDETDGRPTDTRAYLSNLLLAAEFLGRQRRSARASR